MLRLEENPRGSGEGSGGAGAALEKFSANDLPPLWKPRANQFFKIEAIPYLGTGKLDLRRIKEFVAANRH